MLPETSCRISTRSPLPPVTPPSQRPISTSRCRKTSKGSTPPIPRPHESKTALHRSRPCAGSSGIPADCLLNHRSIAAAMCSNSAGRSAWPFPMPCHFARQPRQQVAVACCAMNTGCPLKGVCLPSFRGLAAPNRFTSRSSASGRTALRPFLSRYLNSCGCSRNRRRNGDLARSSKSWSISFVWVSVRAG
jgi:hypothetical protein